MPDEPTPGELARRLEDRLGDVRDDIQQLGVRINSLVSMERYQYEQTTRDRDTQALAERIKGIEVYLTARGREREHALRAAQGPPR